MRRWLVPPQGVRVNPDHSLPKSASGVGGNGQRKAPTPTIPMALTLYVVGESSPNPDDWSIWSEYKLVTASSPDEARQIAGVNDRTPVAAVDMSKPQVLITAGEPSWGNDI